mmetsp:Transcript_31727/g.53521  ORF Transcript_31727/g.53521 Transcript_31727/m.53521 type:complete len:513 (-) Transcript_31727:99-1637(-)|eukprot:CAMPEP_0174968788 /NCGR_PEP_ID=MMETSP0004_2-20121128/8344_1 /TAXON_ID=420556 /ORGANISM="Ochromonas sp., Strain CCMP1393" /LENGTH=512 /DNA_ID=CAMNT_0016218091 /DNA_START=86 /DNA_END=1624 /DNA_ORIENTATION=-
MEDNSGEFSDELDEFEESIDETKAKNIRNATSYTNKPYDEAFEVSQDLSMAESFDGRGDKQHQKEKQLKNDKYDEAVEVSQSLDHGAMAAAAAKSRPQAGVGAKGAPVNEVEDNGDDGGSDAKGMNKGNELSKSQSVLNKPFDEALEFSRSGSDDSVSTRGEHHRHQPKSTTPAGVTAAASSAAQPDRVMNALSQEPQSTTTQRMQPMAASDPDSPPTNKKAASAAMQQHQQKSGEEESSEDEDGDVEESYDNLEGAYNPKDFTTLNVSVEVRDLFQYIERYKPHEVQLEAPLKCFIPEYIPAIGELDAFIKVPRPDGQEDGLGLRYLDEPSANQSDPTVLELQLRAKSKKLQYGDVAVRSIEHADKNPAKIEKWVQDIKDLHSSKPPPQVNYKKNMPDIDALMEVWPEEFEQMLATAQLPSPDLDLSIAEYAKVLCTILDIPTYENPIESLHLMFTLFIEFRNNPHFQARMMGGGGGAAAGGHADAKASNYGNNYGNADVLEIDQGGGEYK